MNWASVAHIGLKVASIVVPQIGLIEQVASAIPTLRGGVKEDAAVVLAKAVLEGGEIAVGKELVSDPEFDTAVRKFIQGYVALQTAVNKRPAPVNSAAQ